MCIINITFRSAFCLQLLVQAKLHSEKKLLVSIAQIGKNNESE